MIDTEDIGKKNSWFRYWILIGVIIIIITGAVGFLIAGSIPQNTQVLVYTTLAASQASVLAIVFSVMFISTQVASERYSPHFANLFTNNGFVRGGISIGIISIALDVIAITIPHTLQEVFPLGRILWALGGMIIGSNFAFFVLLYPTISEILLSSKPTNLLENQKQQINPYEYISSAFEADSRNLTAKHPLQPNFDLIRNSVYRRDISVAIAGVDSLFEVAEYMVKEISEETFQENFDSKIDSEDLTPYNIFNKLYDPIFGVYAKDIIDISNEENLDDISRATIRNVQEFGSTAISDSDVNRQVVYSSFDTLFRLAEDNTRPMDLRETSLSESLKLLVSSAKQEDIFKELVPKETHLMKTMIDLDDSRLANTLLNSLAEEYDKLVDESEFEGVSGSTLSWDKSSSNGPIALILILMRVSSENVNETTVQGNILDTWEKVIKSANSAPEQHQQTLLKRYIEILIYFEMKDVETPLNPENRLDALINEEDAVEAINDMLDGSEDIEEWKFVERPVTTIWHPLPLCDYDTDMEKILLRLKS